LVFSKIFLEKQEDYYLQKTKGKLEFLNFLHVFQKYGKEVKDKELIR